VQLRLQRRALRTRHLDLPREFGLGDSREAQLGRRSESAPPLAVQGAAHSGDGADGKAGRANDGDDLDPPAAARVRAIPSEARRALVGGRGRGRHDSVHGGGTR